MLMIEKFFVRLRHRKQKTNFVHLIFHPSRLSLYSWWFTMEQNRQWKSPFWVHFTQKSWFSLLLDALWNPAAYEIITCHKIWVITTHNLWFTNLWWKTMFMRSIIWPKINWKSASKSDQWLNWILISFWIIRQWGHVDLDHALEWVKTLIKNETRTRDHDMYCTTWLSLQYYHPLSRLSRLYSHMTSSHVTSHHMMSHVKCNLE